MPDGTIKTAVDKLAEAVLAEVPDQLVGYMTERGLKPGMKPSELKPEEEKSEDDDNDDKGVDLDVAPDVTLPAL